MRRLLPAVAFLIGIPAFCGIITSGGTSATCSVGNTLLVRGDSCDVIGETITGQGEAAGGGTVTDWSLAISASTAGSYFTDATASGSFSVSSDVAFVLYYDATAYGHQTYVETCIGGVDEICYGFSGNPAACHIVETFSPGTYRFSMAAYSSEGDGWQAVP